MPIQAALGNVIRATKVKELVSRVNMESPNVMRAINRRHNPTQQTLNRLLRPFKLRLGLAPIGSTSNRRAQQPRGVMENLHNPA